MSNNQHFFLEKSVNFDLEKGSNSGIFKIKGVASTESKDRDGECVLLSGIDHSNLDLVNWNHLGKQSPKNVIGKVSKSYKEDGCLYVHADLYKSRETVKTIATDMENLSNGVGAPTYGFSVEGKVLDRDPMARNVITKCALHQVAITLMPANTDTVVCQDIPEDCEDVDGFIEKSYKKFKSCISAYHYDRSSSNDRKGDEEFMSEVLRAIGIESKKDMASKDLSFSDIVVFFQYMFGMDFYTAKTAAKMFKDE